MKVINPIGRNIDNDVDANYSLYSCACGGTGTVASKVTNSICASCACACNTDNSVSTRTNSSAYYAVN